MSEVHDYEDRHFDKDVYDEEYFEGEGHKSGYKSYNDAKGIVTDQYKMIHELMRDAVGDKPTVLDIGCAYGFGAEQLRLLGWGVTGIDVSEYAIEQGKKLHPEVALSVGDAGDTSVWGNMSPKQFGLVTAVEFFEHIDSKDVENIISNMAEVAEWGFFVVNGRTAPGQDVMAIHGDHGHLNNHNMSWWISQFAKYGEIDWETMFKFNKLAESYNSGVHWHNRCVVIQFNSNKKGDK